MRSRPAGGRGTRPANLPTSEEPRNPRPQAPQGAGLRNRWGGAGPTRPPWAAVQWRDPDRPGTRGEGPLVIRMIRILLSLPFLWLGQLTGGLKLAVCVPLLRLAWAIGGDGATARAALARMGEHLGVEAARAQAAFWMQSRPAPEVAGWAGVMALNAGDNQQAGEYLARGRQLGDDRTGMFELLELMLALRDGSGDRMAELAVAMEARRDLSPAVRKLLLEIVLWQTLMAGRFDEAGDRARHLLKVQDNHTAEMALWALAKRSGDSARARRRLARAAGMPAPERLYYQCLGGLAIGADEDVRRDLAELRQRDAALAERVDATIAARGEPQWT